MFGSFVDMHKRKAIYCNAKESDPMRIDHYFITTDLIDTVTAMDIGDETQGPDHHAIFLEPGLAKSATY